MSERTYLSSCSSIDNFARHWMSDGQVAVDAHCCYGENTRTDGNALKYKTLVSLGWFEQVS